MEETRSGRRWFGVAYAALAAAGLWGVLGVLSQALKGVEPLELAFWRLLLAGGLFLLHAGMKRRLRIQAKADLAGFVIFGLLGVSAFYVVMLPWSVFYAALAGFAFVLWFVLGKARLLRKVNLILFALLGVMLITGWREGNLVFLPSAFVGTILLGVSYASYYLLGRAMLKRYAPLMIYALVLPAGALGLLPFVAFAEKNLLVWLQLLVFAVLSTYVAYGLYYLVFSRLAVPRNLLVATAEPVTASLLAVMIFSYSLPSFLGALLVFSLAVLIPLRAVTIAAMWNETVRRTRLKLTFSAARQGLEGQEG